MEGGKTSEWVFLAIAILAWMTSFYSLIQAHANYVLTRFDPTVRDSSLELATGHLTQEIFRHTMAVVLTFVALIFLLIPTAKGLNDDRRLVGMLAWITVGSLISLKSLHEIIVWKKVRMIRHREEVSKKEH